MRIRVDHCVGHHGMEMPHTLWFGDRHVAVTETVDQWHGSDHRYVKVRCDDGCLYILRHDAAAEDWELTLFERGRPRAP